MLSQEWVPDTATRPSLTEEPSVWNANRVRNHVREGESLYWSSLDDSAIAVEYCIIEMSLDEFFGCVVR